MYFPAISYVEIYGDFPETYRIIIDYTEIEIHNIKQTHVYFPAIRQIFSDSVHLSLQTVQNVNSH